MVLKTSASPARLVQGAPLRHGPGRWPWPENADTLSLQKTPETRPRSAMHLSRFARLRFAHLNTPLEPMERLSKHLGGPRLWIKRDDCTGLSSGGNKTRKLEFLMGEALQRGSDTVITQGATQSNHARQTAAAAAKLGLACHILLEDRTGFEDTAYTHSGNVLLDQ